jgi:hypothetical protein
MEVLKYCLSLCSLVFDLLSESTKSLSVQKRDDDVFAMPCSEIFSVQRILVGQHYLSLPSL